ncbi:glycosyltransferase [Spirosoma fluviale]|uniref:Glycosyltransferase involved in cell wall bisynthesis n=1 Tax=Spirosoma fluviale TaxID=1597977 RepID=A0A286FK99_9BACT|nr:glycosyltransferase [Spirosoma fluviale]SOD83244.1 Glycosyltransferase involved in cell wall bisynthesis [Spirosoma fluviale]
MRILNICAYTWQSGGPPKIIFDHTEVVLRYGHQVDILSPVSPGEKPYPVPTGARLILCQRTPVISKFFREFSIELYQYLRKHAHEYDIIHCHGLWHFGTLAPFMIDRTVAKVITIHGVLDRWVYAHNNWKKQLMDSLAQKTYLQRADLVQINNTDEQQDVLRYLGHTHPNIVIIPNGVKMSDFVTLPPKGTFRRKFSLPTDKKLVLFMSRLNAKKGLDLLLPGFREYVRQHPDTVLALAGPDDGYEATTRQFIEQNNLSDSIRMVGMLTGDDKKAALADADLFTLPSYSEGFSMAVLEAMAAGTPTLVSDRVGFGDVIREHKAAGVLASLTAESVTEGLAELLGNEQLRQEMARNATALLKKQYDIDVVAKQLLDEYTNVCKK